MTKSYKPTSGMASAARRALKWKADGEPGGTLVGLARANQLKDREPLSESTVLRMYSFFARVGEHGLSKLHGDLRCVTTCLEKEIKTSQVKSSRQI